MTITGGCMCRAVRYAVAAEPMATRVCWCRDCQYLAAGSATVNLVFAASAVAVTGPLRDFASIADSGNRMHRQFCERCGTPVTEALSKIGPAFLGKMSPGRLRDCAHNSTDLAVA